MHNAHTLYNQIYGAMEAGNLTHLNFAKIGRDWEHCWVGQQALPEIVNETYLEIINLLNENEQTKALCLVIKQLANDIENDWCDEWTIQC